MTRAIAYLLAWLFAFAVLPAQAQTRAWLDRAQVGHGETATLNIQTDQSVSSIDYAPLQRQFDVGGQTVRRSYQRTNGRSTTTSLFAVGIRPRAPGVFSVPALRVGNTTTAPLQLTVVAPSVMPATPVVASVANWARARTSDTRRWVRDVGRDLARMIGRCHLRRWRGDVQSAARP